MDVIAHRGFAAEGVENSLPRLVAAAERADAVEFDVRLSRDDVPVVFHDERVDRLTEASGPVDAFAADELGELRLEGTDATIPTLEAVLEALSGPIVPELKVESVPTAVTEVLGAYEGPVLVSSFRPTALRALPPSLDRAILASPPTDDADWSFPEGTPHTMDAAIEVAANLDASAIHPHTALCEPEAVDRAQGAGFAINAWTIRDRETAAAMRAAGVDGVIADSPSFVSLEEHGDI